MYAIYKNDEGKYSVENSATGQYKTRKAAMAAAMIAAHGYVKIIYQPKSEYDVAHAERLKKQKEAQNENNKITKRYELRR